MSPAKVYLIPNLLGSEASVSYSIPTENINIIKSLSHFAVENLRESRRFLVKIGLKEKIDQSEFFELNKRSDAQSLSPILEAIKNGHSIGIISDAGCPGIADPGAILVDLAHQHKVKVVPLIGPSSILLALIASGFNGQSFTFHGYLNRDSNARAKELKSLENAVRSKGSTQIFMETPYRNDDLYNALLKNLSGTTKLCIAANISLANEFIQSQSITDWKKRGKFSINKQAAIFLIGN